MFLIKEGYERQTEQTSGGQSDIFQTIGRQCEFRPNYR